MKQIILTVKIVLGTMMFSLLAQNIETGILQGRISDEKTNEGIPFASVILELNGVQKGIAQTDDNGNYVMRSIIPGKYDLKVMYLGYNTVVIKDVLIVADKITFQDIKMKTATILLTEILVVTDKLIEPDKTSTGSTMDKSEIEHIATRTTNNYASGTAGVFQKDDGQKLNIAGARDNATQYYTDGMKVSGNDAFRPELGTENYKQSAENKFIKVVIEPLSTFSIDVDKASYSNIRRFILDGKIPPAEAVRIEEMINYFTYDYPDPEGDVPFSITTNVADCPWNPDHRIVQIGMQGKKIQSEKIPPGNLVFLIDVSGSMADADKLPLLRSCFRLLVDHLRDEDRVAIVTYAGDARTVLNSTPGSKKDKILEAINALQSGGSTAGGAGINKAYEIAMENFKPNGNNRIILATDGDFNVGVSSETDLEKLIEEKRNDGIFLTVLGFGTGNYQDAKMELLADKGNGNYAYIDNILEGEKVFGKELAGTLFTIAKDVKIQVEFNPAKVKAHRLIGYENRMLAKEDFNDDKKDAGELGAGHTVTALYEVVPSASPEEIAGTDTLRYQSLAGRNTKEVTDELLLVKLRYKKPNENESRLIIHPLEDHSAAISAAPVDLKFVLSVAEFGMLLRESKFLSGATYEQVLALAKEGKGNDTDGNRAEFIKLVETIQLMKDSEKVSSR